MGNRIDLGMKRGIVATRLAQASHDSKTPISDREARRFAKQFSPNQINQLYSSYTGGRE